MHKFFSNHPEHIVIVYAGHGRSRDGAWACQMPDGSWETIPPATVKKIAHEVGTNAPTVVTGSCYGGWWLKDFDGISASRPEHLSYGQFYDWLFRKGPLPDGGGRAGHYPMCRGIPI
mmetsp:Transcript_52808/g.146382  ORF Transcript_52808/g.146382 Transcript_52808/m.146382 type:complete len:117 (+) Transcript_52808:617-967(+)